MNSINVFELKVNKGAGIPDCSTKDKFNCLDVALSAVNNYSKVYEEILKFKKLEIISSEEFDLLMTTEDLLANDTSILNDFDIKFLGSTVSTRRRLSCFCVADKAYKDLVNENSSSFTPYTSEELDRLEEIVKSAIGNLSSFIYYQFEFDGLVNANADEVDELNDTLDYYMREHNEDVQYLIAIANMLKNHIFACIPNIGLFELHPELLESFGDLLGVDLYDCENVDEKVMLDFFNGKITQEDFQIELEKSRAKNGDL